jgi:uncharacterized coiled-coil protein SlyX
MSPRYDGPITREQALLAVQEAGLDISKPLDQQMREPAAGSELEARVAALSEQVESLTAALSQASQPADSEQDLARGLAAKLSEAQSTWYSPDGSREDG